MGDAQKLTPDEQIRSAREGFDSGRDFTVAVEEEFAILDPQTLGLANRFEELAAGAVGSPLEPHLVGELIASEIEVRTGRCETFADAAALYKAGNKYEARYAWSAALVTAEDDVATRLKTKIETGLTPATAAP